MLRPILMACVLAAAAVSAADQPEYPAAGPNIFDPVASGEVLLEQAITRAGEDGRRILVFFGANWCTWSRRLDRAFSGSSAEISAQLDRGFVLVRLDANFLRDRNRNAALLKRYGDPVRKHGLPVLLVLESDGTLLATQETGNFAAATDAEIAQRLTEFLARWAPRRDVVPVSRRAAARSAAVSTRASQNRG